MADCRLLTMRHVSLSLVALAAALVLPQNASGWDNLENHPNLAITSLERLLADADHRFERYLTEQLDLARGVETNLAVQEGFDFEIDQDLVTLTPSEHDDEIVFLRQSRFEQSLNREIDLTFQLGLDPVALTTPETVPGDVLIWVNSRCDGAPSDPVFTSCFESLVRSTVKVLIRSGTFAEDNPNVRARHHFHDPAKSHCPGAGCFSPPAGNQGMENLTRTNRHLFFLEPIILEWLRGGGEFNWVGRSARDRALNIPLDQDEPSREEPPNFFALPNAELYLYRGISAPGIDERQHFMALHFIAVGHVVHLLQDMASVAHARNDFAGDHILGGFVISKVNRFCRKKSPITDSLCVIDLIQTFDDFITDDPFENLEAAGKDIGDELIPLLGKSGDGLLRSLPFGFLAGLDPTELGVALNLDQFSQELPSLDTTELDGRPFDAADFWDRKRTVSDPRIFELGREGLANLVNQHFFSLFTVSDELRDPPPFDPLGVFGYESPAVPNCRVVGSNKATTAGTVSVRILPRRSRSDGLRLLAPYGTRVGRYLSSALVPHLAHCRFHPAKAESPLPPRYVAEVFEEAVQRDYIEILFPLTVDYVEKFMRWYFRPRLAVVPRADGRFQLANLTELEFIASPEAVEVAYEGLDGLRKRVQAVCIGAEIRLEPSSEPGAPGPESPVICEFPPLTFPDEPLDPSDLWIIVRGSHGERGAVAEPSEFEASSKEFVVAFDRVQPKLLFDRFEGDPSTEAATADVHRVALTINPRIDVPVDTPPVGLSSLTGDLRKSASWDFLAPVAEPGGRRIALRSDAGAETPREVAEINGPFRMFLLDPDEPAESPAALLELPHSTLHMDSGFTPRSALQASWSPQGDAIFYLDNDDGPADAFVVGGMMSESIPRFTLNRLDLNRLDRDGLETFVKDAGDSTFPDDDPQVGTIQTRCWGVEQVSAVSSTQLAVTSR